MLIVLRTWQPLPHNPPTWPQNSQPEYTPPPIHSSPSRLDIPIHCYCYCCYCRSSCGQWFLTRRCCHYCRRWWRCWRESWMGSWLGAPARGRGWMWWWWWLMATLLWVRVSVSSLHHLFWVLWRADRCGGSGGMRIRENQQKIFHSVYSMCTLEFQYLHEYYICNYYQYFMSRKISDRVLLKLKQNNRTTYTPLCRYDVCI